MTMRSWNRCLAHQYFYMPAASCFPLGGCSNSRVNSQCISKCPPQCNRGIPSSSPPFHSSSGFSIDSTHPPTRYWHGLEVFLVVTTGQGVKSTGNSPQCTGELPQRRLTDPGHQSSGLVVSLSNTTTVLQIGLPSHSPLNTPYKHMVSRPSPSPLSQTLHPKPLENKAEAPSPACPAQPQLHSLLLHTPGAGGAEHPAA